MSHRSPPPSSTEFPWLLPRRLDWSELDVLGHANNARYFTWFEEARMHYFRSVNIPVDEGEGWGPILAHTDCSFLAPVTWPAILHLGGKVTSVGRSSLKMSYAVFIELDPTDTPRLNPKPEDLRCVAHGSGVVVLVQYERGEKVVIDDALRARLLPHSSK